MSVLPAEPTEPTALPDVDTVTRTLRFEVVWPGWRKADLSALWEELWRAGDDLRVAANRAMSALWQLHLGTIPWPEEEAKRGKAAGTVRRVPIQTLVYRCLSGDWQPFGEPMYTPSAGTRRVASHVLLDLAGVLHTRMKTDLVDIRHGRKSLPTFRSMPIGSATCTVDPETGAVTFSLWSGRGQSVTVRPRKLDHASWRALRTALKTGNCRLTWDAPPGRKGRWMMSLAVTIPVLRREQAPLVAAVRLGMETTATLAYVGLEDGKVQRFGDAIDLPSSTWRAVRRVEAERAERSKWNRIDHGQRAGHGRARKLRSTEGIGDVVARTTDTAIRQTAAAVVATAVRRGAGVLALPDLARWSVASELDKTQDLPQGDRAAHRRWYFRWHQGALRQRIREAAEREGLTVIDVSPAGASTTCAECGRVDADQKREGRWTCTCGCRIAAEVNTARVLALRALEVARKG